MGSLENPVDFVWPLESMRPGLGISIIWLLGPCHWLPPHTQRRSIALLLDPLPLLSNTLNHTQSIGQSKKSLDLSIKDRIVWWRSPTLCDPGHDPWHQGRPESPSFADWSLPLPKLSHVCRHWVVTSKGDVAIWGTNNAHFEAVYNCDGRSLTSEVAKLLLVHQLHTARPLLRCTRLYHWWPLLHLSTCSQLLSC